MTIQGSQLPQGFEELAPFVEHWCAPDLSGRMKQRLERPAQERAAFYAAGKGLVKQALAYLDTLDIDRLDVAQTNLLNLTLSMAHAALASEKLKQEEDFHSIGRRAMRVTRTASDWPHSDTVA